MIKNSKAILIFMVLYVLFTLALMIYTGLNIFSFILFAFAVLLLILVLLVTFKAPGKGQ